MQAVLVLFIELSEMKTLTTSIQVHVYLLLLWLEVSQEMNIHISISREDETCQVCCTANSMDDINLLEVHCNCKDWDNKTSCYNNQCVLCVNSIVEAENCTAHVMYMNSNSRAYKNITVPVEPCNLATTHTTNPYTKTKSTIVPTMIIQSTTAAIIVSPTTATILSTTATTKFSITSPTVVEPTTATTESPTTSLTIILSTTIPTAAVIILLSIILVALVICAILGKRRKKLHYEIPTGQEHYDGNNYYQVQLAPAVYDASEPVYITPDPIYNTLYHNNIQTNSPHYDVTSTAYNTTPQYSTTDSAVDYSVPIQLYSTIDNSTVPTPLYIEVK